MGVRPQCKFGHGISETSAHRSLPSGNTTVEKSSGETNEAEEMLISFCSHVGATLEVTKDPAVHRWKHDQCQDYWLFKMFQCLKLPFFLLSLFAKQCSTAGKVSMKGLSDSIIDLYRLHLSYRMVKIFSYFHMWKIPVGTASWGSKRDFLYI